MRKKKKVVLHSADSTLLQYCNLDSVYMSNARLCTIFC